MSLKFNSNYEYLALLAVASVLGATIALSYTYTLAALLALLLLVCFMVKMEYAFALMIVLRSSLDIFTDFGIDIGPLFLNVPSLTSLFIDLGFFLYFITVLLKGEKLVEDTVFKVYLFWVLALTIWVAVAISHYGTEGLISVREWIRIASLLVIYLFALQLGAKIGYQKVVNITMLSLLAPLALGYYQWLTNTGRMIAGIHRIYGTFSYPNNFAVYLILFIGITFWKIRTAHFPLFWVVLLFVEALALLSTLTLGGFIMLATLIGTMFAFRTKLSLRIVLVGLVLLLGYLFIQSPYGQERLERYQTEFNVKEIIEYGYMPNSLAWRIYHGWLLLEQWIKKPLLGYGLGTSAPFVSPWEKDPHCEYLRFLVETGVIGFLLYLFFLSAILIRILRISTASKEKAYKSLAATLLAIFTAYLLGSLADNFFRTTAFWYYFWTILGAVSAHAIKNSELPNSEDSGGDNLPTHGAQ